MTEQEFDNLVAHRCDSIKNILSIKGKEYRRNNNPLHNFEVGSKMRNLSPTRILDGFLLKHLISYTDILNDVEQGILPSEEHLDEKFGDIINYFILQEAMLKKMIRE